MPILERKIAHKMTTLCSHVSYPEFVLPLHKHCEYEIMIFTRGCGKQFVGEGVEDYAEGDVALIGSNVPHLHLCRGKMKGVDAVGEVVHSSGEALQFSAELFPQSLLTLPDYAHISSLLVKSQYGIRFYDNGLSGELLSMLSSFDSSSYTARLVVLLQILERLYECREVKLLSPTAYNSANRHDDTEGPVNRVYTYLYNHFREKVQLADLANYVGQNPTSLCRHFKSCTDKSIFQVLAEIRIEYACKLLSHTNMTVSEVSFSSGYNTPALFFSQFQKLTHLTPAEYRREINHCGIPESI